MDLVCFAHINISFFREIATVKLVTNGRLVLSEGVDHTWQRTIRRGRPHVVKCKLRVQTDVTI